MINELIEKDLKINELQNKIENAIDYIKDRFDEDKGIWIIDCYDLLEILGDNGNE